MWFTSLLGFVGELTIKVPWNHLQSHPVRIDINDVFVLAVPKADTEYDPKLEKERELKLKREKLETAELLSKTPTHPQEGKKKV